MFSQFKWTLKSFHRFSSSSSSIDGHHAFIPRIKIPFIGLENCSPIFCFASSRWILYGFDQFSEKFSSAVYFLQNRITRYHFPHAYRASLNFSVYHIHYVSLCCYACSSLFIFFVLFFWQGKRSIL